MTRYISSPKSSKSSYFFTPRLFALILDSLCVAVAYLAAFEIRFESKLFLGFFPIIRGYPLLKDYLIAGPLLLIVWFLALSWVGGYKRINLPALDEAWRLVKGAFLGTVLSMSAMFLYRESSFSRLVFVMGGILAFILIFSTREVVKLGYIFWVRRRGQARRVLILGQSRLSNMLKRILQKQGDRAVLRIPSLSLKSIQKTIKRSRIDEVLLADPKFDHKEAVLLAEFCDELGVHFRILPDILEIRMGEVVIDESLGLPTIQIKPVSLHGSSFLTKRVMDISLSVLFIGLFFIPLAFVSMLIVLTSRGPVFFRQDRLGYRNRVFRFFKFRTMVHNADDLLEELKSKSDRPGPVFKMKNDPRIFPVGGILRRLSIDEVPQLLNVLKGDMSIVGPRPQVIWETQTYDEWAKKRLNVLPGITGLWQVSGRAELTFEEMIELDIYYIEHWSPGLDFKIIFKTIPAVLFAKGAY
ncbi:MAG: sugar transferase [Elusimicrobia bacterium]|nr:sugar transferase [Candidatus Obscuribacterium magneticum]